MSDEIDPILSDASSDPAIRSLLGAAREELPPAEHVEAMWAKLAPLLPPGPPGGGGAGGATVATAAKAGGFKIAMGVVLAVGIGGGFVATRSTEAPPSVVPSVIAASTNAPPEPTIAPSADAVIAPVLSAAVTVTPPRVAPSTSSVPADDRTEIAILRDAQSVLGSDPARALRLVSEAEQKYPRGQLGQEREMIRIQALFSQGNRTDAKTKADAFRSRWPSSAHLTRLDDLFR